MDREEFRQLHGECEKSLQDWIVQANCTCKLLGECLHGPITLEQRSVLHEQRSRENAVQAIHMKKRQRLFEMARSGYGDYELLYGPLL